MGALSLIVFLTTVFAAATLVNGCDDISTMSCWAQKLIGHCKPTSKHYQYMRKSCIKSCGFCEEYHGRCGIRKNAHTRIVGGTNTRHGDWPWQVKLSGCGGTLVAEDWVVTAAHCFDRSGSDPKGKYAILGRHEKYVISMWDQKVDIAQIFIHPGYRSGSRHNNDIALLKLKKKISFNARVRPACFSDPSVKFAPGAECYVTGWGRLSYPNGASAKILQQVKLPLIEQAECKRAMQGVTPNMFCAGYKDGTKDSCQGDSGGPLVCKRRNANTGEEQWHLWGVVSWGIGCSLYGYYGVYTNVQVYAAWANSIMYGN